MNISQIINSRYTTKVYDPNKKITRENFAQIKKMLRFSPSSLNLQPWHFIIADDEAGKARIAKGFDGDHKFNAEKVKNASHVVIFCSKINIDSEHVKRIADAEERDGRFNNAEIKQQRQDHVHKFIELHRNELQDETEWNAKQLYLNMGSVLLTAAALGIDSTPMEGVNCDALDQEFNLSEKGLRTLAVVAFGYHSDDDFNAKLPKSRLLEEDIFTKA